MSKTVRYYPKAWFKVEYEIESAHVNFKAWRIQALDEETPENSETASAEPCITGYIKWDDCMNFKQDDHYCGIYHAKQVLMLMTEIYKFKKECLNY